MKCVAPRGRVKVGLQVPVFASSWSLNTRKITLLAQRRRRITGTSSSPQQPTSWRWQEEEEWGTRLGLIRRGIPKRSLGAFWSWWYRPKNGYHFSNSRNDFRFYHVFIMKVYFEPLWLQGNLIFKILNFYYLSTLSSCPGITFWKYSFWLFFSKNNIVFNVFINSFVNVLQYLTKKMT